jgi:choline dehydrogenase-like flavoprotein
MIVRATSINGDITDEADFVVVGTGAAGATAARELTRHGRSVILVEEGPWLEPKDLGQGTLSAFGHLFRDFGAQVTAGRVQIPLLQASCVGGSTVINSGITWRLPDAVLARWIDEFGLGATFDNDQLHACFAELEQDLSARPTALDRIGGNGDALRRGANELGYTSKPTHRTERDCEGSGRCLEGCIRSRRQSMNHSFVPAALAAGARLYTEARVDSLERDGDRVTGVTAYFRGPGSHRLSARARVGVLLAASALQTPVLLLRSGLGGPQVGRNFQGHPGVAMLGVFDDPVRIWEGATQSYEVTQFRDQGIKIESLSLPPEMLGVRLPGIGRKLMHYLRQLDRLALAAVPVRAQARGRVSALGNRPVVHYLPEPEDIRKALDGISHVAEIFFAAGAHAVLPGVYGLPDRLEKVADLDNLRKARVGPEAFSWVMTHLMGSCRMGLHPGLSVAGLDGAVHGLRGLYIVDSSLFPTNLGVNPQHTIMAVSMLLSRKLARGE